MRVRSAVVLSVLTFALTGCGGGGSSSRGSAAAAVSTATTTPTTSTTTTTPPTTPISTTPGGGTSSTPGGNTSSGSAATGATSGGFSGGTGTFVDASALLPASTAQDYGADAADLDGDNDIDIAIAVNGGGPSRILFNEGATGFRERVGAFPATVMAATDVRVVDVDGDADLDLIFCANFEPVRVFLNDGAGRFTAGNTFNTGNDCYTYNIALGDADGDGDQDAFLANAGQSTVSKGQNKLFLNNGLGVFTQAPASAIPVKFDDSLDATFLDVDRDGDRDIFVANFGTPHSLLINNGAGVFLNQADVWLPPALTRYGTSVAQGDLDKDGKIDLFVCNEGVGTNGNPPPGEKNTLLLQNPTLNKLDDAGARVPSDPEASFAVRLIDVNGDGWQDVLVSNLRAVQRLYLNQQGILVDSTANFPAVNQTVTNSHGLTIGDFNGDLAPDVFFVRRGLKPWLFLNTR